MNKELKITKNSIIVNLSGEIDQHIASELKEKIDLEIECSQGKNLVLDLSRVTFMDSSGIGLIVGRYKTISALNRKMALCNAVDPVRKMLKLSGIEKLVPYYDSVSLAEKELNA